MMTASPASGCALCELCENLRLQIRDSPVQRRFLTKLTKVTKHTKGHKSTQLIGEDLPKFKGREYANNRKN